MSEQSRSTVVPTFSEEQLAYLAYLLTPRCCHVSGSHDPKHFVKNPESFCESQKAESWERVVETLGLKGERIPRAISAPQCGWCNEARRKAAFEREVEGLEPLSKVLAQCARWSTGVDLAPEREASFVAEWRGSRVSLTYLHSAVLHPHGQCRRVSLLLPKYDPNSAIPADGYPALRDVLSEEEKQEIRELLASGGAVVKDDWGGGEFFSLALAKERVTEEAECLSA